MTYIRERKNKQLRILPCILGGKCTAFACQVVCYVEQNVACDKRKLITIRWSTDCDTHTAWQGRRSIGWDRISAGVDPLSDGDRVHPTVCLSTPAFHRVPLLDHSGSQCISHRWLDWFGRMECAIINTPTTPKCTSRSLGTMPTLSWRLWNTVCLKSMNGYFTTDLRSTRPSLTLFSSRLAAAAQAWTTLQQSTSQALQFDQHPPSRASDSYSMNDCHSTSKSTLSASHATSTSGRCDMFAIVCQMTLQGLSRSASWRRG